MTETVRGMVGNGETGEVKRSSRAKSKVCEGSIKKNPTDRQTDRGGEGRRNIPQPVKKIVQNKTRALRGEGIQSEDRKQRSGKEKDGKGKRKRTGEKARQREREDKTNKH